jgi:cystathionine gamma-synthase
MTIHIRVISQQPPGGRCTLYAGYAEVMARHLGARVVMEYSEHRDAHNFGFPSLLINDLPVVPADRVMLMPGDIVAELQVWGVSAWELTELADALEAPLNRLLARATR